MIEVLANKLKTNNNGITLIALVVTIVVLIILATVSINTVFNDDGIIKRAESTIKIQQMAEEKERLETVKATVIIANRGKLPLDKYVEELIKQGIVVEDEITTNEDGSKDIITDNGYTVNIKQDGENNVIITVEGKTDSLPVRILDVKLTTNTSSIKVDVEVKRGEGATYRYYYKTEGTEYGEAVYEGTETSYTIEKLPQNVTYTIKVEAINKNGVVYKEAVGRTEEVQNAVGIIEYGELSWNNGQAEVTVTKNTEDSLKMEYQVLDEELNVVREYEEIENGGKITGLNLGETVQTRLTDGTNGGSTASITIEDITKPIVTVTEVSENRTTSSIEIQVTATDGEAGMPTNRTYNYYIKKSLDESYPTTAKGTNSTGNYIFTGLEDKESYDIKVIVKDIAGNEGEGELKGIETNEVGTAQGSITFGNLSWSNNKASVTVTKGTNVESNLSIEYNINDGNYTTIASGGTITNLNLGDTVTVRLTDGINYGNTASITVADTTVPNEASISLSSTTTDIESSITATVTQSDGQSGVDITKSRWVYNTTEDKLGTDDITKYTNTFTTNPQTITLKTTTVGTYYLHVLTIDKAGNKTEKVSEAVIIIDPTANWDLSKVTKVRSEDNVTVPVPKGYTASTVEGEKSVSTGFVIKEGTNGALTTGINEFVWVPVSDISTMYGTDANGNKLGKLYDFSGTSSSAYNWTEADGIMSWTSTSDYASYREPDVVTGASSGSDSTSGTGYDAKSTYLQQAGLSETATATDFKIQLQNEFNEMIESVKAYGGFYIGRYETGNLSGNTAVVQKGNTDINNQTWYTQYRLSKTIKVNDNVVSSMIWGCQWDATLRWMQTSENEEVANYVTDSTGKGNYYGTNGNLPIATGSNTAYAVNNIYDMAGNVWDWSLEACKTRNRALRGGAYDSGGFAYPSSYRYYNYPAISNSDYGSRSALYVAL